MTHLSTALARLVQTHGDGIARHVHMAAGIDSGQFSRMMHGEVIPEESVIARLVRSYPSQARAIFTAWSKDKIAATQAELAASAERLRLEGAPLGNTKQPQSPSQTALAALERSMTAKQRVELSRVLEGLQRVGWAMVGPALAEFVQRATGAQEALRPGRKRP